MTWHDKRGWLGEWLFNADDEVAQYAMKSSESWTKPPSKWNIVPEHIERPLKKLYGDLILEVFVPIKTELEQYLKSKDDKAEIDGPKKESLKSIVENCLAKAQSIKKEWDEVMPKDKLAVPITPDEQKWKQEGYHTHRTLFHYALGQVLDKALEVEKATQLTFENKMDDSEIWEKGRNYSGFELPS
ncbi:hypothetical protein DM02DRAFT_661355 [Periconia macrospinosa]|uniref:Uncharacterized protein n=1 Tax=Periconia macrospinosa TaxID=97972 RepID=A0A2V1D7J5_9PLEO|nr:hypothetical protein DM02DRAFT_661355 [Periconia macrospinosa]